MKLINTSTSSIGQIFSPTAREFQSIGGLLAALFAVAINEAIFVVRGLSGNQDVPVRDADVVKIYQVPANQSSAILSNADSIWRSSPSATAGRKTQVWKNWQTSVNLTEEATMAEAVDRFLLGAVGNEYGDQFTAGTDAGKALVADQVTGDIKKWDINNISTVLGQEIASFNVGATSKWE